MKRRLTRCHADFLEVGAATVGGVTVLVAPAVGGFLVEHLEAATFARHNLIWRETGRNTEHELKVNTVRTEEVDVHHPRFSLCKDAFSHHTMRWCR